MCEGTLLGAVERVHDADGRDRGGRFSEENVHLICPWHGWEFDLATGASVAYPELDAATFRCDRTRRATSTSRSEPPTPGDLDLLGSAELQALLSSVTSAYAARARAGEALDPFGAAGDGPTATDVAVTVLAMLERVGIEPFELGLWRAWGTPIGEEVARGDR